MADYTTPLREIDAKIYLYEDGTKKKTFYKEAFNEIKITREGGNKFFGFGISQKAEIKMKKPSTEIYIGDTLKIYFDDLTIFPMFEITEIKTDATSDVITITAYDYLHRASTMLSDALTRQAPYSVSLLAYDCSAKIGTGGTIKSVAVDTALFSRSLENGANLDGKETIRQVLDAIAEATGSFYYISVDNQLIFKTVNPKEEAYTITKDCFFTLESGKSRSLKEVAHITELGDNVSATKAGSGDTQYLRNNPLLELTEDTANVLNRIINFYSSTVIDDFTLNWRGNPSLLLGQKILIETNENPIETYIVNDVITFNGGLSQTTEWHFEEADSETTNPVSIGEAINQTYARVDKVNKRIDLVAEETKASNEETQKQVAQLTITTGEIAASVEAVTENISGEVERLESEILTTAEGITMLSRRVDANSEELSTIQQNADSITASVKSVEAATQEAIDTLNSNINEVESKITQTASNLNIEFTNKINDIDSVTTSTGFTFNKDGLRVKKSGSEMTTKITEDGMIVYRNSDEMLTANNTGVKAVNLHATTYLIIGTNSRIEDMSNSRTGVFWIGG